MARTWCTTCGEDGHPHWLCRHPPERAARMLAASGRIPAPPLNAGTPDPKIVLTPKSAIPRRGDPSAKPADHHLDKLDDVHPDPHQNDRPANPKLPRRQRLPRQDPVNRVHSASGQKSVLTSPKPSTQGKKSSRQPAILPAAEHNSGDPDAKKATALYAPHGECTFCDARRDYAAAAMRRKRAKPVT